MPKRIINGPKCNNIYPLKHPWALEKFKAECSNHWSPQEVNMSADINLWKSNRLSVAERRIVTMNLGFFSTADSLAANNIVLGTYRHITSPECRLYLLRQGFTEAMHTESYQHIVESLGMDEGEIFNMYHEVESIRKKDEFLMPFIDTLTDINFKTGTRENNQKLLISLIMFACIMEGMMFYCGFVQVFALGRQNKMTGTAEQFQYILRDESMHLNFGVDMINQIKAEDPAVWDAPLKTKVRELFIKSVELESAYADDAMPTGILGLNSSMFKQYLRFICNRRCLQIGLDLIYDKEENPFPWMSEMLDIKKEKNFFETRVLDYSVGTIDWNA